MSRNSSWNFTPWIPEEPNGMEETLDEEHQRKLASRERRDRLNGVEPVASPYCNCGAKFDREFPNVHMFGCNVYKDLSEWKKK